MSASLVALAAEVGDVVGIDLLNPQSSQWQVLDGSTGSIIITPDTVTRFEFKGSRNISDYPVEQGAFATYNKVKEPYEIRMVMICAGLNYAQSAFDALGLNLGASYMDKSDFIDTLEYMLDTTDVFSIVTPERTYENANLIRMDYRREAREGATMLIVDMTFEEVRQVSSALYTNSLAPTVNSASPDAADNQSLGTVQTYPFGNGPVVPSIGVFQ